MTQVVGSQKKNTFESSRKVIREASDTYGCADYGIADTVALVDET